MLQNCQLPMSKAVDGKRHNSALLFLLTTTQAVVI